MKTLQERLLNLEQTNKDLHDDLNIQKNRIEQLGGELTRATLEKDQIQSVYQRKIEVSLLANAITFIILSAFRLSMQISKLNVKLIEILDWDLIRCTMNYRRNTTTNVHQNR